MQTLPASPWRMLGTVAQAQVWHFPASFAQRLDTLRHPQTNIAGGGYDCDATGTVRGWAGTACTGPKRRQSGSVRRQPQGSSASVMSSRPLINRQLWPDAVGIGLGGAMVPSSYNLLAHDQICDQHHHGTGSRRRGGPVKGQTKSSIARLQASPTLACLCWRSGKRKGTGHNATVHVAVVLQRDFFYHGSHYNCSWRDQEG